MMCELFIEAIKYTTFNLFSSGQNQLMCYTFWRKENYSIVLNFVFQETW